tara:strand:+ start:2693 stop:3151 length:459 start_codon:yes stop_codon:yes gene_type:complete
MKKILLVCLILVSCSKSDDNSEKDNNYDEIIGSWTIIESGGALDTGETYKEEMPCSNVQKIRFFEDGLFDSEIWWGTMDGDCEFDQIRKGEWLKTTRSDKPGANYRLTFYEIPMEDDEEVGYPKITFSGNTMKILYDSDGYFDYTYKLYEKE